jgi:hypothetical protein
VRAFELRADRPFDDRYGQSIRVKTNVVEVLRAELARTSWQHEPVAIGAATDPYQPAEGRYRLTRGCIEALGGAANPFSLITRGPLIVRDVDVLAEAAARTDVSVTFSVPTLDDEIWRKTEPGTAHPRQRLARLIARGHIGNRGCRRFGSRRDRWGGRFVGPGRQRQQDGQSGQPGGESVAQTHYWVLQVPVLGSGGVNMP